MCRSTAAVAVSNVIIVEDTKERFLYLLIRYVFTTVSYYNPKKNQILLRLQTAFVIVPNYCLLDVYQRFIITRRLLYAVLKSPANGQTIYTSLSRNRTPNVFICRLVLFIYFNISLLSRNSNTIFIMFT